MARRHSGPIETARSIEVSRLNLFAFANNGSCVVFVARRLARHLYICYILAWLVGEADRLRTVFRWRCATIN